MVRTRVGYAGGAADQPTYRALGDHTETLQIDFDPRVIRYEQLLEVFWHEHHPTARPWSRQYMSLILHHDETQRAAALASLATVQRRLGAEVHTEVRALKRFYRAEDYHQKYRLRQVDELWDEMTRRYSRVRDVVDSTAAARLNGFCGGHGTATQLQELSPLLDLSPRAERRLRRMVGERARSPRGGRAP